MLWRFLPSAERAIGFLKSILCLLLNPASGVYPLDNSRDAIIRVLDLFLCILQSGRQRAPSRRDILGKGELIKTAQKLPTSGSPSHSISLLV